MKQIKTLLMLVLLMLTSCVSQHTINRHSYRPDVVHLKMTMDDYEYMGDVTVEAEYKIYLGIFRKVLTINGEPYSPRYRSYTRLTIDPRIRTPHFINRALYKVLDTYPDADYIIPGAYKKVVDHMLGGRIVKEQQTLKVYRLKNAIAQPEAE